MEDSKIKQTKFKKAIEDKNIIDQLNLTDTYKTSFQVFIERSPRQTTCWAIK